MVNNNQVLCLDLFNQSVQRYSLYMIITQALFSFVRPSTLLLSDVENDMASPHRSDVNVTSLICMYVCTALDSQTVTTVTVSTSVPHACTLYDY